MSQTTTPRPQATGGQKPAPPQRPAGHSPLSRLPEDLWQMAAVLAAVAAVLVVCQWVWRDGFSVQAKKKTAAVERVSEIRGSGPIRLNELMTSNSSAYADEEGQTSDWVEVINVGSEPVNLYGYALAKTEKAASVFRFSDMTLQPGECAVVFADSSDGERPLHAPFRLSSAGDSMMLFNRSGAVIDSVNIPALGEDVSYIRREASTWGAGMDATPGLPNTEESYLALHVAMEDPPVEISEVVTSNTGSAPDENGLYRDWFELHNRTGETQDLSGWFVSDDATKPLKWRLPDGFVLEAGAYRVVYASGMDLADPKSPHTNFSLSSKGESLQLSDSHCRLVDKVDIEPLNENASYARQEDRTWSVSTPTPGSANR